MTEIADRMKPIAAVVLCVSMLMGVFVFLPSDAEAGLPTDAWITGTVTDGTDPLPDVYIKVMLFMADGIDVNYSFTDASGNYMVGVLGGFDYMVLAANGSYYMAFGSVRVDAGKTVYSNFTMTGIAPVVADVTLKGFIKDEFGVPATAGHILGFSRDPSGPDMPNYANVTTPNATGYFEVNTIPQAIGGGAVAFDFPGYQMTSNETTNPLVSGNTYWFNITLKSPVFNDDARIYGTVTDGTTGLPIAGVLVQYESWNNWSNSNSNFTFTDASGQYDLGVVNGTANINYIKSGYTMLRIEGTSINPGDNILRDVKLYPLTAEVRGNITDLNTGLGIPFARAFAVDESGNMSAVQANDTGYFELGTFDGVKVYLGAEQDGYSRNVTIVSISPGDLIWHDFGLRAIDCWLTGTVTDYLTGLPIQGAWVQARSDIFEEYAQTNASGQYNMSLVSGHYRVDIGAMNYRNNVTEMDLPALLGTQHDIALLPWNLPDTTHLSGWVNDTGGMPIAGTEVRIGLQDGGYQNSTSTNSTGFYQMMVPSVPLIYRVTAWNHAPEFGAVDATGLTEVRLDVVLGDDVWGPNVTFSQTPTENITWDRPTVIDLTIEESNLQNVGIFEFMYWKTSIGQDYFYAIDGLSLSLDPFSMYGNLNYTVVGDTYTIHIEWNATLGMGGWLMNSTDQVYLAAYDIRSGSDRYFGMRGNYRNATVTIGQQGTAIFDFATGDFVAFDFDQGSMYPPAGPGDPTALFSPMTSVITQNVTNPNFWGWVGSQAVGDWSTIGLKFGAQNHVPTGDYRTLLYANDFGQHGWASAPLNLTVDNGVPVADAGSDQTAIVNTQVELSGTLSTDDVGIVSYAWNFTDGGNGYTVMGEVQHWVFTTIGDHLVTLTVTDGAGHQSASDCVVTVVADEPPVANAGPDQTGVLEDTVVTFDGAASYDDIGIANYTWTVLELTVELYGVSPQYTFVDPGTYHVNLTVTDSIGQASAPDQMVVTVVDTTAPVADAGPDFNANVGSATELNGSLSYDYVGIVNYTWSYTDGATTVTLYGAVVSHVFSALGDYTVTLTVTDAEGLQGTDTVVVSVVDGTAPNAVAGPDQTVVTGSTVTLNGSGSTDNIGVTNYTWTFTDVGAKTLYGATVAYQFDNAGEFIITLTARDAAGNSDIDTVVVNVEVPNAAPHADAGPDQTVVEGANVTFDASGSTDDHGIALYTWTFLYDGQTRTLTGISPSFVFQISGIYTVTLTVTDTDGLVNANTVQITVQAGEEPTPGGKSFIEQYWWALALVVVLVVVGLLFFMMKGKGGKTESAGPGEDGESTPRSMRKVKESPPPEDEEL